MPRKEIVHDASGKKIAEVHHHSQGKDRYYNIVGRYVGKADQNGKRDPGRLLADKPVGGY